jgi:glycosyltransferase involved in cell wall biosynthesis
MTTPAELRASSKRIRVLQVIARLNLGGPAHLVSLLSGLLDPSRYETLLVTGRVGRGEVSAEQLPQRYGADLASINAMGPEMNLRADVKAFSQMQGLIRRFRPDIVHTHTAKAGFIGRLAAVCGVRPRPVIVHTYHGHVLEDYFSPFTSLAYRQAERLLSHVSDALIGVSQQTVDDLTRLGVAPRSKFRTIPIGLDLDPFLEISPSAGGHFRREVGLTTEEVLVTFVGRLVPIKRVDLALKAVAQARSKGAPIRLAIVGDGRLRPDLERLATALGIEASVNFVGYRVEISEIAAATDVALLTSTSEGTPVWLIEAAAAGRPAIATAVGGVLDVVGDGCGFSVAPGDEEGLADALKQLTGDPESRRVLGANARRHVKERFSMQRLLEDIDSLYEELIAPTY